jgi:hypothetical protein
MRLLTNNTKSLEKNTMISKPMNLKSRNNKMTTILPRELTGSNLRQTDSKLLKESIKKIFIENNKNGTRRLMIPETIPMFLFKKVTISILKFQKLNKRSIGKRSNMRRTCMISLRETRWTIQNLKK